MGRIRAIVYGVGRLGMLATRLMVEKDVEIVGAINRAGPKVGRDLGALAGLGRPLGAAVSGDAAAVLAGAGADADIAFVSVYDDMARMYPIYAACLEAGLNVISVGAHDSYPWRIEPEPTAALDRIAKRRGVTITGSGNQDIFMVNIASLASGACHRIDSIAHRSLTDVDSFGVEVARIAHVGATVSEYRERAGAAGGEGMSVYTTFWDNLAADLGLTVTDARQGTEPITSEREYRCESLDITVEAGRVIGITERLEFDTAEGIPLLGENQLKLCAADEREYKSWRFRGEPDLDVDLGRLDPGFTTVSQPVNRIPDVIGAEPGYVTLEKLPKLKYRHRPLGSYLR